MSAIIAATAPDEIMTVARRTTARTTTARNKKKGPPE
jgi:hypothetical protein